MKSTEEIAFQESAQHFDINGAMSSATGQRKIHPERITQLGFSLASSSKVNGKRKRTAEIIEVHGGGGGRIIPSVGRKDKHSKVCTAAGGMRDRRVRLSPGTAIQFYDVQDRLGYDRPSKAIDWLMKEAKAAIDALCQPAASASNKHLGGGGKNQLTQPESDRRFEMEHLINDDFNPISSFDFQSSTDQFQAYYPVDDFNSLLSPVLGHGQMMFSQREPLQSIYSRIADYSSINNQFPGVSFSNEEMPISAVAMQKWDEMDKLPVPSKKFATNSFLHYEE